MQPRTGAASDKSEPGKPTWWQVILLMPLIIFVGVMNGRVDGRGSHIGLSLLLMLISLGDPKVRLGTFIYFCAALFNVFCYWLIRRVWGIGVGPRSRR